MVRSMTGFGRAEVRGDTLVVTVEARSVNHRHLDVALRLPRTLAPLEMDARRLVVQGQVGPERSVRFTRKCPAPSRAFSFAAELSFRDGS